MNLFFIYDTSVCSPDDDPSEAILYFYPFQELESERSTLFYQIIGIAQFLQATFTSPSVVSLNNSSFTVCRLKHYLLVLGGHKNENVQLLKTQLQLIYKIFTFYYSSFVQVFHMANNNKQAFKETIDNICTQCLSIILRHQDKMRLGCHTLPVVTPAQSTNTKPVALLNMCQAEFEVLAGAVFSRNTLLHTQCSPEITSALSLLATENESLGVSIPLKYRLPPGVRLRNVYLTQKEITHLQKRKCRQFTRGRRKQFGSLWSNSGSEGDIESDYQNQELSPDSKPNEIFSAFRIDPSIHYQKYSIRRHFPTDLPCSSHGIKAPFPVAYQCKKQSCDLEFQCLLCKKSSEYFIMSHAYFLSALKRWNSEMDIMCFYSQQHHLSHFFRPKFSRKKYSKSTDNQKRRKVLIHRNSKPNSSSSQEADSIGNSKSQKTDSTCWTNFFSSPFSKTSHSEIVRHYHNPLPDEELRQGCMLYEQRCGDCLLILLLSAIPPVNVLVYLWHCGFSFLPSITYEAQSKASCKYSLQEDKSDFSIYTYKYQSKVLYGKLPFGNDTYFDNVKSSLHEDFYSDPLLYSMNIVDHKLSLCAYNTKEKQIFYEQASPLHRKANWFSQLWERASKRAERYLNITLPKF